MAGKKIVFVGFIASSKSLKEFKINKGYLCVENGVITKKGTIDEYTSLLATSDLADFDIIKLGYDQFLMPGFVDCHTHAPQFPNLGLGLDKPLLEWLDKYTFPLEKEYSDVKFAANVYEKVVKRLLSNGTTTACYFGSLHLEGTLELVKCAIKLQQRALVGKVSMNEKNEAGYYNDTKKELADVETFIKKVLSYENDLVQPVVTPRFALSCDNELMTKLAQLADKYNCRIQSHIAENNKEIECVLSQHPNCSSYSDVYDKCGILNERCIMAHAIYLSRSEMALLSRRGTALAHCPASNTRLQSGACGVRTLLNASLQVGLGTDVSGGDSASILDAVRRAVDVSTYLDFTTKGMMLSYKEAFYLATLGGAAALNLEDKIGSLDVGKEFDALLVGIFPKDSTLDYYESYCGPTKEVTGECLMQKFLFSGDDRNILQVFVKGEKVKDIL